MINQIKNLNTSLFVSYFNLRGTVKQIGRPATGQEKIFENHISDNGLVSTICIKKTVKTKQKQTNIKNGPQNSHKLFPQGDV